MATRRGKLEVICGCMFSGKTEELIRRVTREKIAGRCVQVLKSHRDTRYSPENVFSHSRKEIQAHRLSKSTARSLIEAIDLSVDVIAIDEIQFFDEETANICNELADKGYRVIVAGLDLDFRGEPFRGPMRQLMAQADDLTKLNAICVFCGETATKTQRLVKGKPAKWDENIIVEGNDDTFLAVCRKHHRIQKPPIDKRRATYKVIE